MNNKTNPEILGRKAAKQLRRALMSHTQKIERRIKLRKQTGIHYLFAQFDARNPKQPVDISYAPDVRSN